MRLTPLDARRLDAAASLSAAVRWNQVAADWAVFLRDGAVRAVEDGGALPAATAATLPVGPGLAWISMVITRPDRRRQGLAGGLLDWAVDSLAGTGCIALDATPDGQPVYRRRGFRPCWGFTRYRLPSGLGAAGRTVRALREADWPAVLALDAQTAGMARIGLLRDFAARLPAAALVIDTAGGIDGVVLARDGLHTAQIGPLLARDPACAQALLAGAVAALPRGQSAIVDCRDGSGLGLWLELLGAVAQRPFLRMALGDAPPGDAAWLYAVGGPEFG